jgi:hypothetical protein
MRGPRDPVTTGGGPLHLGIPDPQPNTVTMYFSNFFLLVSYPEFTAWFTEDYAKYLESITYAKPNETVPHPYSELVDISLQAKGTLTEEEAKVLDTSLFYSEDFHNLMNKQPAAPRNTPSLETRLRELWLRVPKPLREDN